MNNKNPEKTQAWAALNTHFKTLEQTHLRQLFEQDPKRFTRFHARFEKSILLDYSKKPYG